MVYVRSEKSSLVASTCRGARPPTASISRNVAGLFVRERTRLARRAPGADFSCCACRPAPFSHRLPLICQARYRNAQQVTARLSSAMEIGSNATYSAKPTGSAESDADRDQMHEGGVGRSEDAGSAIGLASPGSGNRRPCPNRVDGHNRPAASRPAVAQAPGG
jgi:hypothetical protein